MPAWPVRPAAVEGLIGETDVAPVHPPPMHDPAADMADATLAAFNAPADRVISAGGPHEDRFVRIVRWLTGAGLAVALHVGLFVAVTSHAHEAPVEADGSPLTVDIIDMSSSPAAPPTDTAPGPEASAAEAQDAAPPVIQPPPQDTPPAPAPPSEAPPVRHLRHLSRKRPRSSLIRRPFRPCPLPRRNRRRSRQMPLTRRWILPHRPPRREVIATPPPMPAIIRLPVRPHSTAGNPRSSPILKPFGISRKGRTAMAERSSSASNSIPRGTSLRCGSWPHPARRLLMPRQSRPFGAPIPSLPHPLAGTYMR